MNYHEVHKLVVASGTLEGVNPLALADALAAATSGRYTASVDDPSGYHPKAVARTAAVAAYELGRLGLDRGTFRALA